MGGGGILDKTIGGKVFKKLTPETDVPEVPEMPETPGAEDAEVQAARKKERKLARLRRGRESTILSNLRKQLSPGSQGAGAQLG
jgi:hypothetical protein